MCEQQGSLVNGRRQHKVAGGRETSTQKEKAHRLVLVLDYALDTHLVLARVGGLTYTSTLIFRFTGATSFLNDD